MANISANINKLKERKAFNFKLKMSLLIIAIWFVVEIIDNVFDLKLEQFGLKPKSINGLYGILTFPFLHGDWNHLFSNSASAIILFTALFVFHEKRSIYIFPVLYIGSGLLLWLIGKNGTNHIGASGLIYAVAFFLFVSSIIIRDKNSMALSFFIIMFYGSMVWGVMPYFVQNNVSWEGHIAGAMIGVVMALFEFRNYKQPHKETIEEERPFFERHPLE